jgi:hypothetical protein
VLMSIVHYTGQMPVHMSESDHAVPGVGARSAWRGGLGHPPFGNPFERRGVTDTSLGVRSGGLDQLLAPRRRPSHLPGATATGDADQI